jgi:transposase-like protein
LRWLDKRQRYICDSCGKVFDQVVVERHNPGVVDPQMHLHV